MGRGAKAAFCVAAAFGGILLGSWVTTFVVPIAESVCVEIEPAGAGGISEVRCTVDATHTVWRLLLGGVPGALIVAGLALVLLRRYERRSPPRFVKPT